MAEVYFKYQINQYSPSSNLDTLRLFEESYIHPDLSAIDTFFEKTTKLNTIISDPQNIPDQLTSLILLGYVSAVESYFREIIRKIIIIDPIACDQCANKSVTYGAATTHNIEMLPEALLENCQFISKSNILKSLENYVGNIGRIPQEVEDTLIEFEKICHLRHCIVHRFGFLGSQNAIHFGLVEHKKYLEKPIKIGFKELQQIFLICNNTTKVINNYLFSVILSRTTKDNIKFWEWDYRKDKNKFQKYFKLFHSEKNPPPENHSCKDVYNKFRKAYRQANKKLNKK